jgi:hypothetical protein
LDIVPVMELLGHMVVGLGNFVAFVIFFLQSLHPLL